MGIFSEISRIEGPEFRAEVDEIIWLLTHGSQLIWFAADSREE